MHVLLTLGLAWSASLTALHVRPAVYETRARTSALAAVVGRREALGAAVAFGTSTLLPTAAIAGETKTVMVAGATGQTGRRVLERLAATPGLVSVGAVRNVDKAKQSLASSSTVVRGAMLDKVGAVDTSAVRLAALDVVKDSVESMSTTLKGVDALVIAVGFVPGNPFKMDAASHAVDNVGTVALIDAAKAAGVRKVVLVSSILTDGPAWGQEKSPGYQVTNAFGHVLEEKLVAEKYLRASGLDYTIVRPGGLKSDAPTGPLYVSGENTLNSGEISRDLVADVCVASLSDPKASNRVVEIVEAAPGKPGVPSSEWFNGLKM
mmetsp:Transcript_25720/g.83070  ORF Transcript_25720/g.83070 Transcript_25720/m.83070 type:complete len:321 (-) Transcript_25720:385-1347(-)